MTRFPRVLPVGDAAATLELGDSIDPGIAARVRAVDRALAERPLPGLLETVPSYRSLLAIFDPERVSAGELAERLLELAARPGLTAPATTLHRIPAAYGGDAGPDLDAVARHCGLAPREVVSLHASVEYTAYLVGFTPGFAYLGPLPEALLTPRRTTPRVRVPAGAVAIAGRQTAVYPAASPGGWNLIGRTGLRCFDPAREPPALILAGDRVRFVPVDRLGEPEPEAEEPRPPAEPALEVVEAGLLTTVQDGGRPGRRLYGVPAGGALDRGALERANRAVGNPPQEAALECTVAGPTLCFLRPLRFAVSGADLGATLERPDLGAWRVPHDTPVLGRPGNVLRFAGRRSGCRAYLSLAGGVDVPLVLGSRSTDLTAGFGGWLGRALRAGDRLGVREPPGVPSSPIGAAAPPAALVTARVVPGPQADHFAPEALEEFLSETWTLGATSDRVGARLDGARLAHAGPTEIVTDGMVPGCVQVPPDGQPIVMLGDAPTTGGYPKLATVIVADLPRLAQLVPGEGRVRFTLL